MKNFIIKKIKLEVFIKLVSVSKQKCLFIIGAICQYSSINLKLNLSD